MTNNEKLMQAFINEFRSDDENIEEKADKLKRIYNRANPVERALIDNIFVTLCGWSFPTLISKADELGDYSSVPF